jgi:hypothetical protein
MPQPGQFAPRGEDEWVRRVQDLEARLQRIEAANVFGLTGITPKDGGTDLDGFVNINGPLSVTGAMDVTGNADFTGNVHIGGTLDLPAGIINNDALQAPVYPAVYHADTQNISITSGSNVEKVGVDVAVPAGYTQALVSLTITMNMTNNSASTDLAYVGANINGTSPGWASVASATVGQAISLNNTVVALVTGLTGGGTFRLTGKASSGTNTWPAAGSSNVMNLNATVQFLR